MTATQQPTIRDLIHANPIAMATARFLHAEQVWNETGGAPQATKHVEKRAAELRALLLAAANQSSDTTESVLSAPDEPGMVRYRVEVVPHDPGSDGSAWESGTNSPAHVARVLRGYARQAEHFTSTAVKPR